MNTLQFQAPDLTNARLTQAGDKTDQYAHGKIAKDYAIQHEKLLTWIKNQENVPAEKKLRIISNLEKFSELTPSSKLINIFREDLNNDNLVDGKLWKELDEEYINKFTFLDAPYFFVEVYHQRQLNLIFENIQKITDKVDLVDFYKPSKIASFEKLPKSMLVEMISNIRSIYENQNNSNEDNFNQNDLLKFIIYSMLGNKVDLEKWPNLKFADLLNDFNGKDSIMINDLEKVYKHLKNLEKKPQEEKKYLIYFFDNVGLEVISDLFFIDYLLQTKVTKQIRAQLKPLPFFVSDALYSDMMYAIEFLKRFTENLENKEEVKSFMEQFLLRINNYIVEEKLIFESDYFFCSYLPFWKAPENICKLIIDADFIIFKGEFNFLKTVECRQWNPYLHYTDIVHYFPTPLVSIRIPKTNTGMGFTKEFYEEQVKQDGIEWLSKGKYGVIQSNLK